MEMVYLKVWLKDLNVKIVNNQQQKGVLNVNRFGIVQENVKLQIGEFIKKNV
jgi:hypothetical protein